MLLYNDSMTVLEKLEIFNDSKFSFDEKWHSYSYGSKKLRSVSNFISQFKPPFDSEAISKKESERTGEEQSSILERWRIKNQKSIFVGSSVHNWIENYYKGLWQELPTDEDVLKRINSFNLAWGKYLHKLTPIAFEKRIFNVEWGIAGTLDALFSYNDKIIILDYKSNEEFKDDDHPKGKYNKLLEPFDNLWQNHLNDYSIQVSMYSLILEHVADIKIDKCYLLHISNEGFQMRHALDLREPLLEFVKKSKIV